MCVSELETQPLINSYTYKKLSFRFRDQFTLVFATDTFILVQIKHLLLLEKAVICSITFNNYECMDVDVRAVVVDEDRV